MRVRWTGTWAVALAVMVATAHAGPIGAGVSGGASFTLSLQPYNPGTNALNLGGAPAGSAAGFQNSATGLDLGSMPLARTR